MPLLVDTGPLYALADADDAWHDRVRDFLAEHEEMLLAPVTVLPEVAHLLRTRLGGMVERTFVASVAAKEVVVEELRSEDLDRTVELMDVYSDIGFVDATVAAMAERLRLPAIVTTDRRHFGPIRPRHRAAFDLLPL